MDRVFDGLSSICPRDAPHSDLGPITESSIVNYYRDLRHPQSLSRCMHDLTEIFKVFKMEILTA